MISASFLHLLPNSRANYPFEQCIAHANYDNCSHHHSIHHASGRSHEMTKNVLNANKMTDIVNAVFICT